MLPQLILLIMSHFSLHSYAESAFSFLSAHCLFFFFPGSSWLPLLFIHFQGVIPHYQLSSFHLFSFQRNASKPLPILPIMLRRNSLRIFMQYLHILSSNPSLKHSHARNLLNSMMLRLLAPCDYSLSRRAVLPLGSHPVVICLG